MAKRFLTIGYDVTDLDCLVVGGGCVGGRKAQLLAEYGAKVTVLSPDITSALQDAADVGRIIWRCERYDLGALEDCCLVVAATDDATLNRQIAQDAREKGIFFCNTSAGSESSVIFPALLEHKQATVAVHSHGQDLSYSLQIRDVIAHALGLPSDFEKKCVGVQLTKDQSSAGSGNVYLIGAGPGAPDLITIRGLEAIRSADVVIYDRILGEGFLERLDMRTDERAVEWLGACERGPARQAMINQKMLDAATAGKVVARVKNGDPFVFGRGMEEVRFLVEHGIPFEVVPGLTSATGVPSAAGYPLTCRAKGRSFAVTSARLAGGDFNEVYPKADTLVVLMAVGMVDRVADRLIADGWLADTPAVMIERGTMPDQRCLSEGLSQIAELVQEAKIDSPAVLIIGQAAANPISKL